MINTILMTHPTIPATKKDLKAVEKRLDTRIDKTEKSLNKRMENLEFNIQQDIKALGEILPTRNEISEWKDEMLKSNDVLSKKMDFIINEFASQQSRNERVDETLNAYSKRFERIEKHIGLTA